MTTDLASTELGSTTPSKPLWLRSTALWFLKIGIAALLLQWLWRSGHLDARALRGLRTGLPLWGLMLSQMAMIVCQMLRWARLMAARDVPLSWRDVLLATGRGQFASVWTPSNLGLDGVRLWQATRRHPGRGGAIVGVLLLDRMAGLVALLCWVAVAPLWWHEPHLNLLSGGAIAALIGIGVVSWWARRPSGQAATEDTPGARPVKLSARLAAAFEWPSHQRSSLVMVALLSLATHLCNAFSFACALTALGQAPSLAIVAAVAPAIILSSVVPLTPLGLGVADTVAQTLFATAGVPNGANATMLGRATWLLLSLICGLAYFWPHAAPSVSSKPQTNTP